MSESKLPPRKPIANLWDFVVRGYRPVGCWVGVAVVAVQGLVLPIAALCGNRIEGWPVAEIIALITLLGLGWHQRTVEKREGLTS